MQQDGENFPETRVVVDATTIYEVDLECYRCLSDKERALYFDEIEQLKMGREPQKTR